MSVRTQTPTTSAAVPIPQGTAISLIVMHLFVPIDTFNHDTKATFTLNHCSLQLRDHVVSGCVHVGVKLPGVQPRKFLSSPKTFAHQCLWNGSSRLNIGILAEDGSQKNRGEHTRQSRAPHLAKPNARKSNVTEKIKCQTCFEPAHKIQDSFPHPMCTVTATNQPQSDIGKLDGPRNHTNNTHRFDFVWILWWNLQCSERWSAKPTHESYPCRHSCVVRRDRGGDKSNTVGPRTHFPIRVREQQPHLWFAKI